MYFHFIIFIFLVIFVICYIFILFIKQRPNPTTAGSARINAKERQARRAKKRKGIEAERVKPPTPTRATDDFIGGEERKAEGRRKRKKQGAGPQPIS